MQCHIYEYEGHYQKHLQLFFYCLLYVGSCFVYWCNTAYMQMNIITNNSYIYYFIVCYVLLVICVLLVIDCYLLFYCWLFIVSYYLIAGYYLLCFFYCWLLFTIYVLLLVIYAIYFYGLLLVARYSDIGCYSLSVICLLFVIGC